MTTDTSETGKVAVIIGVGGGISASLARALHARGWRLVLASRNPSEAAVVGETGAHAVVVDGSKPEHIERLFDEVDRVYGRVDLAVYNASFRKKGPVAELEPAHVERALMTGAFGAFLMARAAAQRMLPRGNGTIFFTGASASVKGYARSAPFAMAKFALRGLSQSLARELHPRGIHVAHFIIDGLVRNPAHGRLEDGNRTPGSLLDPDAIAASYLHVLDQPRSVWTSEVELRPWVEPF